MKNILKIIANLLIFFISSTSAFSQKNSDLNSTQEILLPSYQYNQMKSDLPAKFILMDSNKTLWVIGQKSLWRWQTKDKDLKKIPLIFKGDNDKLMKLAIHNELIYVLSEKGLFQVSFEPLRAVKLKTKNKKQFSIDLSTSKKGIHWITNNKIYLVNHTAKMLKTLNLKINLSKKDKVLFIPEKHLLWQVKPKQIVLNKLSNKKKIILKNTKYRIRNIQTDGNEVFISTRYTVLRYSKQGKLLQSIPVENGRKLILMEQTQEKHSYLFSDKLLELYSTSTKNSLKHRLNLGRVKKASMISSYGSRIGLLLDGVPRVFQLSGKW